MMLSLCLYCSKFQPYMYYIKEKFEDTEGVIRSRTSMNDSQYNGQKKKEQTMIFKTPHRKLKIEQQERIQTRIRIHS